MVVKVEQANKDKGKGQEVANLGNEEKATPVSRPRHLGTIAKHYHCSVIAVSWPSASALAKAEVLSCGKGG
jgi:hypothetical protein